MMKRNLVSIFLLTILAIAIAGNIDAQSLKNKPHEQTGQTAGNDVKPSKKAVRKLKKEQKRKEKQERKKAKKERKRSHRKGVAEHTIVVERRPEDDLAGSQMKLRYRIDVLVPIYLDELVKGQSVTFKNKVPEKAEQGLAFYEGVMIAADSLKRAGFKVDIYVHDIGSAAETASELIKNNKLDSSDLIIGAVSKDDMPVMAEFAKRKQVNFVSAMSTVDVGIQDNLYFTMLQPTLKTHSERMADAAVNFIMKERGTKKITMLYRTSSPTDNYAYNFVTADSTRSGNFEELLCNTLPDKAALWALFDTSRPNVVIMPVTDVVYADSLLRELVHYFPGTHFDVYGMPSWRHLGEHDKMNYPNITISYTLPFNVNRSGASAKYVTRAYRRDYGGDKVSDMVFRGYETMFWYANLLKQYGTIFNTHYADISTAPFTGFDIKLQTDKRGNVLYYENKNVYRSSQTVW